MRTARIFLFVSALAAPTAARAQTFPADNAWVAFSCGPRAMFDLPRDQGGAIQERDVVGDARWPAGFRAVDAQFLYLRLRVDDAPTQGGSTMLRPAAWGFAFSVDGLSGTYELLITLDGLARSVALYRNSATTVADSPTDPADTPPVASFPFGTHGRTSLAPESNFNGSRDHFVDLAVPWSALNMAGMDVNQTIVAWAGTSTVSDRLNGDLACHDGNGGNPDLAGSASGSTTAGNTTPPPSGGSGGGPGAGGIGGAAGLSLEGGPACSYTPRAQLGGGIVAFLALLMGGLRLLLPRKRRR